MVATTLSVLMIGNSFSICVKNQLPPMVKADPTVELRLASLYIGGCPLSKHWNNVVESEADPSRLQYKLDTAGWPEGEAPKGPYTSINKMLDLGKWDVITIQQASHESWDYKNYQPYADNLVAFIQKKCPDAKIMIQQTWAYRCDDGRIREPNPSWGFNQAGMAERVIGAYEELRLHTGFHVIPTGRAVAAYRRAMPASEVYVPDTPAEHDAIPWPGAPKPNHDPVGNWGWRKNDKGAMYVSYDTIHLNQIGEFLQACTWYGALYGKDPTESTYNPGHLPDSVVRACKEAAKLALAEQAAVEAK